MKTKKNTQALLNTIAELKIKASKPILKQMNTKAKTNTHTLTNIYTQPDKHTIK